MNTNQSFPSPLDGVRVLEISHVQAGPVCGMMLADMGAEVTKIESFGGDLFRRPLNGANFQNFNRNKRAIALDLKSSEGLKVALDLAADADVLVENFLPGALDRLGLGFSAVKEVNPRIIYASISGFGQSGEFSKRPAFEPILQAMSGMMEATGDPDRLPVRVRPAMIDYCTGASTAFAIAAALYRREKLGVGEKVEVALLDVAMYAMSPYITHYKRSGQLFPRSGSAHPATAPNQNFETIDGYICIAAGAEHMWQSLCRVLGLEEIAKDSRFANQALRNEHATELVPLINAETAKQQGKDLEARLLAAGVPCGVVRSVADIVEEPHVQQRGVLEKTSHPYLGEIESLKTPIFLNGVSSPMRRHAPMLGENTLEVLREMGYSSEQIEDLAARGIVAQYQE